MPSSTVVFDGRRIRYPTSKSLVRISRTDVQESVAVFAGENPGDHAFNRRVFANMRCSFVCGNDGCGFGVGDRSEILIFKNDGYRYSINGDYSYSGRDWYAA